jgi:hypothetical protein
MFHIDAITIGKPFLRDQGTSPCDEFITGSIRLPAHLLPLAPSAMPGGLCPRRTADVLQVHAPGQHEPANQHEPDDYGRYEENGNAIFALLCHKVLLCVEGAPCHYRTTDNAGHNIRGLARCARLGQAVDAANHPGNFSHIPSAPTLVTLPLVPGPWPSRPMEGVIPHVWRLVAREDGTSLRGGRDGGHEWCGGVG